MDAARELEIPHGGSCPKGRKAEDGLIPEKYVLQETESDDYLERTEANVVAADATIIFTYGAMEGGSLSTAELCRKHEKPCGHVNLEGMWPPDVLRLIATWLENRSDQEPGHEARVPQAYVLNVVCSRESTSPGIRETVHDILMHVLVDTKIYNKLVAPLCLSKTG